jgi:hypothetical protein
VLVSGSGEKAEEVRAEAGGERALTTSSSTTTRQPTPTTQPAS